MSDSGSRKPSRPPRAARPLRVVISISLSPDTVARVDRAARRAGETRSGFVSRVATEAADVVLAGSSR